MKIAVLMQEAGDNPFNTLEWNGYDVTLWEFNSEYAKTLSEYRKIFIIFRK